MAKLLLAMLLALLAACSEPGPDNDQQPSTQVGVGVSSLPANTSMGDGYPPPAPDLCVWANSVDALLWGRLRDVRLSDTPAINYHWATGWSWAASCPYGSSPALELEVDVTRSLRGGLAGRIVARVGFSQVVLLNPMPYLRSGALAWTSVKPSRGAPVSPTHGPLVAGRPVGLALQYVPSVNAWSVMGQAMFGLGADGRVVFQECIGPAFEPPPKGAEGLTPGDFDAAVAACVPDQKTAAAVAERRAWVSSSWGPIGGPPSNYVAAKCLEPPELSMPLEKSTSTSC